MRFGPQESAEGLLVKVPPRPSQSDHSSAGADDGCVTPCALAVCGRLPTLPRSGTAAVAPTMPSVVRNSRRPTGLSNADIGVLPSIA